MKNNQQQVECLTRKLKQQQEEIGRLRDALAHFATDESDEGWIAIGALTHEERETPFSFYLESESGEVMCSGPLNAVGGGKYVTARAAEEITKGGRMHRIRIDGIAVNPVFIPVTCTKHFWVDAISNRQGVIVCADPDLRPKDWFYLDEITLHEIKPEAWEDAPRRKS